MIARLKYSISTILGIVLIASCNVQQSVTKPYHFFVAGHVYGIPDTDPIGIYAPFKHQIKNDIVEDTLSFGIFTGDIVVKPTRENWAHVMEDLNDLSCPVHFAPGNHDMGDRGLYQELFGHADTSFSIGNDWFLIFDNTKFGWNPDAYQTILLEHVLQELSDDSRLFIFCHNVVWQDKFTCAYSNSQVGKGPENHLWNKVVPMIEEKCNKTYWFAGDVGATKDSKNVTYNKFQDQYFITSGMGNQVMDSYLRVKIEENAVNIVVVELESKKETPIEDFICP